MCGQMFGHVFYIAKQEQIFITTCVRKHFICELQLKNFLYMHYCVPAHFRRAVRDVLNNAYHDRWIGRGGPIVWHPRSPDLIPLDFYLWGNLETPVYAPPVDNEETLHHRTVDASQTILD
jgi:hypothetical protein